MKLFEPFRDVKEQVSEVSEVNVYGGSIFSGALVGTTGEANIKKFVHWTSGSVSGSYYHACYSTHHTASTAVELLNVTYGFSNSSSFYSNAAVTNQQEKSKIYRLYAKKLLGSSDERFNISGTIRDELIFVSLARSQHKDELRKGALSMGFILTGASGGGGATSVSLESTVTDEGAATSYFQSETSGDHAYLLTGTTNPEAAGIVWYKAGVMALVPELISFTSSTGGNFWSGSNNYEDMVVSGGAGGSFDNTIDAMRYRITDLSIINQTNLHSTFYFCRALNDEFNYSSNPTFIDEDKRIITTSGSNNLITRTYITKVGLVGDNDEILAVASVSRPLKKAPDNELMIKVRLDY